MDRCLHREVIVCPGRPGGSDRVCLPTTRESTADPHWRKRRPTTHGTGARWRLTRLRGAQERGWLGGLAADVWYARESEHYPAQRQKDHAMPDHPTPATPPATLPPDEVRVQVHALIDRLTPEALVA